MIRGGYGGGVIKKDKRTTQEVVQRLSVAKHEFETLCGECAKPDFVVRAKQVADSSFVENAIGEMSHASVKSAIE